MTRRFPAVLVLPLAGAVLILTSCGGEDRPSVDVIQGSPNAGGASTGSVSASGADVAGPQPTQVPGSVYNVVSNVDSYFAIGLDMRDLRALVSPAAEGRTVDWPAVLAHYEQGKNQKRADGTIRGLAALATEQAVQDIFPNGVTVYGRTNFLDAQMRDAITGTGKIGSMSANARRNLVDKTALMIAYGKALQEMEAARTRIAAGNLDSNAGAPHAVDEAWATVAGAIDGSGLRSYSILGAATGREINFGLAGKLRNPLEASFTNALKASQSGDAAAFDKAHAEVKGYLNSIFYLGALRYAKSVEIQTNAQAREGGLAEGWAYWQTIRAAVAQASPSAAQTVEAAFSQSPETAWPEGLTKQVYDALNQPSVLTALGIPAGVQVKTPPAQ